MKVIDNTTGEILTAQYGHNSCGNKRMWVNGKFFSDKAFDKRFSRVDYLCVNKLVRGEWIPINK